MARRLDGQQQLPLRAELMDGMAFVIHAIHLVVRSDKQPVGPLEQTLSPRGHQVAVPVQHDDWMLASAEGVQAVPRVNRDSGDIADAPPVWKLAPPLDLLEDELPGSYDVHVSLSLHLSAGPA